MTVTSTHMYVSMHMHMLQTHANKKGEKGKSREGIPETPQSPSHMPQTRLSPLLLLHDLRLAHKNLKYRAVKVHQVGPGRADLFLGSC